jgi:hypothetical protein
VSLHTKTYTREGMTHPPMGDLLQKFSLTSFG